MHITSLTSLLLAVVAQVGASPAGPLIGRATTSCNRDNLLRCFTATPGPASAYCSSVLGKSTVVVATTTPTSTVTGTVTSTSTVPATATSLTTTTTTTTTDSTTVTTTQTTATAFSTVFVTVTATQTEATIVATVTVTSTTTNLGAAKRGLAQLTHNLVGTLAARQAAAPTCLTKDGTQSTSDSPARVTSACNCLGVTRGTTSVTSTAPAATVTTTQTSGALATTTTTSIITSTITVTSVNTVSSTSTEVIATTVPVTSATTTSTTTTTTDTSTTTTVTTVPCAPTFTASGGGNTNQFKKVYQGSGFRENDQNPGTSGQPPISYSYPASMDLCAAVKDCAGRGLAYPGIYYQLAVYKSASTGIIECRSYYDPNYDPSYFNVPDPDVAIGLGYSAF